MKLIATNVNVPKKSGKNESIQKEKEKIEKKVSIRINLNGCANAKLRWTLECVYVFDCLLSPIPHSIEIVCVDGENSMFILINIITYG